MRTHFHSSYETANGRRAVLEVSDSVFTDTDLYVQAKTDNGLGYAWLTIEDGKRLHNMLSARYADAPAPEPVPDLVVGSRVALVQPILRAKVGALGTVACIYSGGETLDVVFDEPFIGALNQTPRTRMTGVYARRFSIIDTPAAEPVPDLVTDGVTVWLAEPEPIPARRCRCRCQD